MGLFTDTVQSIWDNGFCDGNCVGWNPITESTREYLIKMREREKQARLAHVETLKNRREEAIKRTNTQIENELIELETLRYVYRVSEKNLLRVKNQCELQSVVIKDIVDGLLEFYEDNCEAITEIQDEIRKSTGIVLTPKAKEVNEVSVKKDIAKTITYMVDSGISNGLPLSSIVFRNIVKDLELLIGMLEYDGQTIKKLDVERYFEEKCKKSKSMIICQNCGREMITGIPYCFNCFDGRYS